MLKAWGLPRSTFHERRRRPLCPRPPARRGPKTRYSDEDLLVEIRRIIQESPFHGESHRKARAALLTAPEWLLQSVSLRDAPQSVMARFRVDSTRIRIGALTTFSFYADPVGVLHSHAGHEAHDHAHGEADPCNAQPVWSIQVRDGRIESIIANPETPIPLDAVEKRRLPELAQGRAGGLGVRVWAVDGEQALVAIGVDPDARTAGQWVLIWRSLLPAIYPEIAALSRRPAE